jgi:vacuolar-type H+-ATPase subunit I/STV1
MAAVADKLIVMESQAASPAALRQALARLDAEIRAYPTPIPRCDAQFNHLLEERDRIRRLLEEVSSEEAR